ncbi:hypothetical protein D4716_21790, partial [Shigella boydii]|nr:hypothetical protein [Shigella boydii]EGD4893916.1 hypothetical protein [Shigella boydii]
MKYRTKIKRKMPYAGCSCRVFIGKLYVIATLSSVIRKRRPAILINIISLGTGIFYKNYMRLKKSAIKTDFFKISLEICDVMINFLYIVVIFKGINK